MSTLEKKMSALTGGNVTSSAKLKALFGPPDAGSGGGGAGKIESSPELRTRPDLG